MVAKRRADAEGEVVPSLVCEQQLTGGIEVRADARVADKIHGPTLIYTAPRIDIRWAARSPKSLLSRARFKGVPRPTLCARDQLPIACEGDGATDPKHPIPDPISEQQARRNIAIPGEREVGHVPADLGVQVHLGPSPKGCEQAIDPVTR
jgi:hypothetical protein